MQQCYSAVRIMLFIGCCALDFTPSNLAERLFLDPSDRDDKTTASESEQL